MLSGLLGWKDCSGFASKIRNFARKKKGWMEKLSQTKLSGLKFYYLSLTLRVAFSYWVLH